MGSFESIIEDFKSAVMENNLDKILSASLKNWAAGQAALPAEAKERLLQKAAVSPTRPYEPKYFSMHAAPREFSNHELVRYTSGGWLRDSFTMSLAWPGNLALIIQAPA